MSAFVRPVKATAVTTIGKLRTARTVKTAHPAQTAQTASQGPRARRAPVVRTEPRAQQERRDKLERPVLWATRVLLVVMGKRERLERPVPRVRRGNKVLKAQQVSKGPLAKTEEAARL
jgi:hypothetical protein